MSLFPSQREPERFPGPVLFQNMLVRPLWPSALEAAAKGSALAGFLPIEGGIPWIPSVPVEQDHFGVDRSDQDYEPRITYNPFARPRGYGKADPFERAEDRAAELVVSAPGRNGKVRL